MILSREMKTVSKKKFLTVLLQFEQIVGQPGGSVGEEGEDPGQADQPGDVGDRPDGQRADGKDYSQEPEGWVTPLINIFHILNTLSCVLIGGKLINVNTHPSASQMWKGLMSHLSPAMRTRV